MVIKQEVKEPSPAPAPASAAEESPPTNKQGNKEEEEEEPLWLRIFHINDVYELDNLPSLQTVIRSYPNHSSATAAAAAAVPDCTLIVVAGDFLSPSLLSSLDNGASMVDCLNALGCTHVGWGNHEADVAFPQPLRERIDQSNFVWINSNLPELNDKLQTTTREKVPEYDIIEVVKKDPSAGTIIQRRRVALLGFLTNDPSLYRPGAFGGARIEPVVDSAERLVAQFMNKDNQMEDKVDFILPLTHLSIQEDRTFCQHFGGDVFPLVLGGHDHDPFDEVHNGSRIIKAGMDAQHVAVIDIQWNCRGRNSSQRPDNITVTMVPTADYTPDPALLKRVHGHQVILRELEKATLFNVHDWLSLSSPPGQPFSTLHNRLQPTTGCTAFCAMLRMGLHADCAILNAGSVRAGKTYDNDHCFSWSDLKTEIPFPTRMTTLMLPGAILEAIIRYSRRDASLDPPIPHGGFLHTCNRVHYDQTTERIVTMGNRPFDPHQDYLVAMPIQLFQGMDDLQPLLEWARESHIVVNDDSAVPAKNAIVSTFSSLLWLQLGSFPQLDHDGNGVLTRAEVHAKVVEIYGDEVSHLVVDHIFHVADLSGRGVITPLDMTIVQYAAADMIKGGRRPTRRESMVMREIASHVLEKSPSHRDVGALVDEIRATVDVNQDGSIQREEVWSAMRNLRKLNSGDGSASACSSCDVLETGGGS